MSSIPQNDSDEKALVDCVQRFFSKDENENASKNDSLKIAETSTEIDADQSGNVNGKERKSIVRRLHRHQAEIAVKEGKKVSKYLERQLEREKKK